MKSISAEELERRFDDGEDITDYLDLSTGAYINEEPRKVSFTMPEWLINVLDREASHLAISRQAVAVTWLAEKAKEHSNLNCA